MEFVWDVGKAVQFELDLEIIVPWNVKSDFLVKNESVEVVNVLLMRSER